MKIDLLTQLEYSYDVIIENKNTWNKILCGIKGSPSMNAWDKVDEEDDCELYENTYFYSGSIDSNKDLSMESTATVLSGCNAKIFVDKVCYVDENGIYVVEKELDNDFFELKYYDNEVLNFFQSVDYRIAPKILEAFGIVPDAIYSIQPEDIASVGSISNYVSIHKGAVLRR